MVVNLSLIEQYAGQSNTKRSAVSEAQTHSLGAVIAEACRSLPTLWPACLVKSLLAKGFGIVNDHTDTYLILNVHSCALQLEPCLDLKDMAPETLGLV